MERKCDSHGETVICVDVCQEDSCNTPALRNDLIILITFFKIKHHNESFQISINTFKVLFCEYDAPKRFISKIIISFLEIFLQNYELFLKSQMRGKKCVGS